MSTLTPRIGVRYSCWLCGLRDIEVQVKARDDEDVKVWVEDVMGLALSLDHQARSPQCRPTSLKDVKIPMIGSDRIGGPAKQ